MNDFGFCSTWPDELKELSRRHYRLACRVRNLDAAITRVDPTEFDTLMDQLELARQEFYDVGVAFWRAKWAWEMKQTGNAQKGGAD